MAHEFETCSCVLCLSFRRGFGLLYSREASGALQRRGVELLRVVHSQLLDFTETGETGAATPADPGLPTGGDESQRKVVKEEPKPEEERGDSGPGSAPIVAPAEGEGASASSERPTEEKTAAEMSHVGTAEILHMTPYGMDVYS